MHYSFFPHETTLLETLARKGGELPPGPVCLNGLGGNRHMYAHTRVHYVQPRTNIYSTTYANVTWNSTRMHMHAHVRIICTRPFTAVYMQQPVHVLHMKKPEHCFDRALLLLRGFFFFHPNTSSQEKELRGEYCRAEHFFFFLSPCSNSTCTPWLCREICQCFHYFEFFFFSPCVFERSREWLRLLRYALYMMCITAPHAAKWLQRNPRNSFTELCCQRGEDIKGGEPSLNIHC